eukprot:TRINITY_DN3039_c0_g2_i13.p1 TRINITY_DN3039_c0_g2~~TRINITY_DN3039_c0_g2_i13.p1  ORF type:complete len:176 (-),score=25.21 TRINITY_DN3039_c0_g2_i13:295-822(-)
MIRLSRVLTTTTTTRPTLPSTTLIHSLIPRYSTHSQFSRSFSTATATVTSSSTNNNPIFSSHDKLDILLSDSCANQINHIKKVENNDSIRLRISVEGGGCSGFKYNFSLDEKLEPEDRVFSKGGAEVVVDNVSLDLMKGSIIDYHTELIKQSFRVVNNPISEKSCGCGTSFSVKT